MRSGFFDLVDRLALLDKLGDPLPKLQRLIDREAFRSTLDAVHLKPRKSLAERKPYDVVSMFEVLVLQHLYNLADKQTEYRIRDRYSFGHRRRGARPMPCARPPLQPIRWSTAARLLPLAASVRVTPSSMVISWRSSSISIR